MTVYDVEEMDALSFSTKREDRPTDVHVMPDLPKEDPWAHLSSVDCWCTPRLDYVAEGGGRSWVHNERQVN